ncbi:MAG TPA: hypothetical protein VHE61_17765 [Opitutaceae bacterium]|nr:hypothetical protein [Opitutaceae bacterium]
MNAQVPIMFLAGVVFAGCSSPPRNTLRPESPVKPGLILLTPDEAEHYGLRLTPPSPATRTREDGSPLDAASVIASTGVKAYALGRVADPTDPDLLHESHVVYRRETFPQWRLDPPVGERILVGPRVTDGRAELQPLLSKELTAYLAEQRKATEANQQAIAALFEAVNALNQHQQAVIRQQSESPAAAPPPDHPPSAPAPEEP